MTEILQMQFAWYDIGLALTLGAALGIPLGFAVYGWVHRSLWRELDVLRKIRDRALTLGSPESDR